MPNDDNFGDIGEVEFLDDNTRISKQMNYPWALTKAFDRIMQCVDKPLFVLLVKRFESALKPYLDKKYREELKELSKEAQEEIKKLTPKQVEDIKGDLIYKFTERKFAILMDLARRKNFIPLEQITSFEG